MTGSEKYPRRERLTHRREFQHLYQNGTKTVGPSFICFALSPKEQGRKFGFAVTRKVGGAVVRNRIKRYLREIFRTHRQQIPEDTQLVLVARYTCARLDYHQCETAVLKLLHRGNVLNA